MKDPRIKGLHFVLILSIIGSGYMLLSSLLTALMLPMMQQTYSDGVLSLYGGTFALPDEFVVGFEMLLAAPQWYYFLSAILYAVSLYGVIVMWHLRKTGFHAYTLAQLLLLLLPVLFFGKAQFDIGNLMLTILFVAYYFFTLKNLGIFSGNVATTVSSDEETTSESESADSEN